MNTKTNQEVVKEVKERMLAVRAIVKEVEEKMLCVRIRLAQIKR